MISHINMTHMNMRVCGCVQAVLFWYTGSGPAEGFVVALRSRPPGQINPQLRNPGIPALSRTSREFSALPGHCIVSGPAQRRSTFLCFPSVCETPPNTGTGTDAVLPQNRRFISLSDFTTTYGRKNVTRGWGSGQRLCAAESPAEVPAFV